MDLISTHYHVPDFCTADVTAMITDSSEYALSCLSMQRELTSLEYSVSRSTQNRALYPCPPTSATLCEEAEGGSLDCI